jgi:hypothetical protein
MPTNAKRVSSLQLSGMCRRALAVTLSKAASAPSPHETRFATRQHTPETERGAVLGRVDQTTGSDHVLHTQRSLSSLFPFLHDAVPQLGLRNLRERLAHFFGCGPMFEIVIAVAAAVSISIFLVHAIEAYLTH